MSNRAALLRWPCERWLTAWLAAVTAVYLACTAPFLNDFPNLSGDDAWVMSVSHRLATEGRLGTELFTGFFRADEAYFLNLPVQHVWQAVVFKMLGTGVLQARLVSLAAAVVLVWVVAWLAYRWYGLGAAVIASCLLVFWRSGVIGSSIPLLQAGRTARYDLTAVCTVWVAVALMDLLRRVPGPMVALALGACAGVAALTQFHGVVAAPLAGLWWWWLWRRGRVPGGTGLWLAGGFVVVLTPYIAYVVSNWDAFLGQQSLHARRLAFGDPAFYLQNLANEWRRVGHWFQSPGFSPSGYRPFGVWLLVVGLLPALWHIGRRWLARQEPGDGLVLGTIVVCWAFLALGESTKAPLYALMLVPSLCMAIAVGAVDLIRWTRFGTGPARRRQVVQGVVIAGAVVVFAEGGATYASVVRAAARAQPQAEVAARLRSAVPPGPVVVGFEAWWWPLHGANPLRSWSSLWAQWLALPAAAGDPATFHRLLVRTGARYVVLSRTDQTYVKAQPAPLQSQFWTVYDRCMRPVASVDLPTYGEVRVREVVPCEP